MSARVLVAGVGNIFLGDDGFGAEAARRLAEAGLPDWVQVADYGTSGMHLAFDLAGQYDTTILLDAVARGGEPGTVYVIEPDSGQEAGPADDGPRGAVPADPSPFFDAHGMQPDVVLGMLRVLGAGAGRVLVVGCEPASTDYGIGLSPPVAAAVGEAVRVVTELVTRISADTRTTSDEPAATGSAAGRHPAPEG